MMRLKSKIRTEKFYHREMLLKIQTDLQSDFSSESAVLALGYYLSKSLGYKMSLVVRKLVFGVSDQVGHKPGCAVTADD